MFCRNCGNELSEQAKFCASCGIPVQRKDTPASSSTSDAIHPNSDSNKTLVAGISPPPIMPTIKATFGKVRCAFGVHKWYWEYEKPDSCTQRRTCNACGRWETRVEHSWGEWNYEKERSCQTKRTCQRCGAEERGEIKHVWGSWEYKAADSCQLHRVCQRCGAVEHGAVKHVWGGWYYKSADSCRQERKCQRCGAVKEGTIHHIWDEWHYVTGDSCQQERVCQHCGLFEIREAHQWGVWQYESPTSCQQVRYCMRCHKREYGKVVHQWTETYVHLGRTRVRRRVCRHCGARG